MRPTNRQGGIPRVERTQLRVLPNSSCSGMMTARSPRCLAFLCRRRDLRSICHNSYEMDDDEEAEDENRMYGSECDGESTWG